MSEEPPEFGRLSRHISTQAVIAFEKIERQNPRLFMHPVNVDSVMTHIERDLWRKAALDLLLKDTAVTQEIMRLAGEI